VLVDVLTGVLVGVSVCADATVAVRRSAKAILNVFMA
jgi:hypothetical protein